MTDGEQLAVKMSSGRIFRYEVSQADATCQKCGAPLHWVTTHNGKQMPCDVPDLGEDLTTCHYDTCEKR